MQNTTRVFCQIQNLIYQTHVNLFFNLPLLSEPGFTGLSDYKDYRIKDF